MGSEKYKIAVYAICKNEDKFVEKWYKSMSEADYVLVLDTGSTDNTMEHLRSLGAIVFKFEYDKWRFDVSRNDILKLCPPDTDIFVSTDLDEVFEEGWAQILRDNWDKKYERAIYKYSWSHLSNGADGRVFQYDKIHNKNWEWRYPVHEILWNKKTDSNLYSSDVTLNLFDKIHLHHYPDKSKSRASYLPLLEQRAEENPNDYYGLIYLGHEYYYRRLYDKSIKTLKKVISNFIGKVNMTSVELASCYLFMGDCHKELGNLSEAISSYTTAIAIDKTYREPYLNMAKLYLDQKEYELAIHYAKSALHNSIRHYTWLEKDLSWTHEPYDILAIASFYAGHKRDSLAYSIKAYSYEQTDERLLNNINLILQNTTEEELIL